MRLRVHSRVPRKAPGGKTQEGNRIPRGGAGKPEVGDFVKVTEAQWPAGVGGEDPWGNAKAARWMAPGGQAVVRAGLLAWKGLPSGQKVPPRKKGILVIGVEGTWPEWLKGKSPGDVAQEWRSKPPLWLLECLPNLPAAQLAIEMGVKGPVESRRGRAEDAAAIQRILKRWSGRGIRQVLVVRLNGEEAQAEVWSR